MGFTADRVSTRRIWRSRQRDSGGQSAPLSFAVGLAERRKLRGGTRQPRRKNRFSALSHAPAIQRRSAISNGEIAARFLFFQDVRRHRVIAEIIDRDGVEIGEECLSSLFDRRIDDFLDEPR